MELLMVPESLPLADQAMLVEAVKGSCREESLIEKALRNYKICQVLENAARVSDHPALAFFLPRVREDAEGVWTDPLRPTCFAAPQNSENTHTPLSAAVNYSPNGVIDLLVDAGADCRPNQGSEVKVRDSTRAGAAIELHQAALKDQTRLVHHLTIHGSDVNHPDQNGATPLIRAAELGHLNTAKVLLACGAQVH
ncbi:ankyrin repeat domain-containing protein [Aspergillus stella-maris]|uniref:ankyrin repeat domain-containing protein n=1 Tax=Aspergillus stella-maris TaxID=1810926 RepID=UPI003CCDDB4C